MNLFANRVVNDDPLTGAEVRLLSYGIYLMHGGDPAKFDDLTDDDIIAIYITNDVLERLRLERVAKMGKGALGGDDGRWRRCRSKNRGNAYIG